MREDFRPTVTVRLGDDGNPEINIDGTTMQAQRSRLRRGCLLRWAAV